MSYIPTGIFGQYWLEQLHKQNLRKHGFTYKPFKFNRKGFKRDLLCPLCHKEADTLSPVSPFKVSYEGILKIHPQPQMRIKGIVIDKHGKARAAAVPVSRFRRDNLIPFYDKDGIKCPVTGNVSNLYYIIENAHVCRKCIWHKLGGMKGKLKVDGEVVEY